MITECPQKEYHRPNYYLINAEGKTLGRLASLSTKLLMGKETSYYMPSINQGNYVTIINAEKIVISGKKNTQKIYYRNSQRPGSLKQENFQQLHQRLPARIVEKAIWGMLPKGLQGRNYYHRLYVFAKEPLLKRSTLTPTQNWIFIK